MDSGAYGEIDVLWVKQKGFNTIKIDNGLINQALKNEQSKKYLFDLIASAKSLGINTLAEGVENKHQLSLVKACNFDFAQGYYFSKPLLAKDFTLLLTISKFCRTDL